jgi:hypothetical protein
MIELQDGGTPQNREAEMAGIRRGERLTILAGRLCPHKTDGEVARELVPRAGKTLTPDGARAHAIGRVAAVVARTCDWGDYPENWDVGDHRFLVLDFGPKKGVSLYVQIWTEPGRVFPALATDDVKRMLGMAGCQVVDAEPGGPVSRAVKQRFIHVATPFPFVVEMRGQASKTPATYEAMRLITLLRAGRGLRPELLEQLVRECPFGRAFRDHAGDLLFIGDFVAAGTTVPRFLTTLNVWMRVRDRAEEMLLFSLAPPAPRIAGGGGGGGEGDIGDASDEADDDEAPRGRRAARTVIH